jgi:hypothetical protein
MQNVKEIVIHVELDPERLAVFPVVIRGTLDAWAQMGMIGDVAAWAVYESHWQPPFEGL